MMPFQANKKQASILGSNSKVILILQHHIILKEKPELTHFLKRILKK